jgi:hypothetical protein
MIRSSACQRQADPFPALSGRHGERRSYTTPWDTIAIDRGKVLGIALGIRQRRHAGSEKLVQHQVEL